MFHGLACSFYFFLSLTLLHSAFALQRHASENARDDAAVTEAVVVLLRRVDPCHARRLLQLQLTASSPVTARTVWVLHDANFVPDSEDEAIAALLDSGVRFARQPVVSETAMPGGQLFYARPHDSPVLPQNSSADSRKGSKWKLLQATLAGAHTPRSGSARVSFLRWAVDAGSQYSYNRFWLVDDDTHFTGPWHLLFDSVAADGAHVVSKTTGASRDDRKFRACRIAAGVPCGKHSEPRKVQMSVIRLSFNFLSRLLASMSSKDGAQGHHEALIYHFCRDGDWCRHSDLPEAFVGFVFNGGSPGFKCDTAGCDNCTMPGLLRFINAREATANSLYHPVKCEASRCGNPSSGADALKYLNVSDERNLALEARLKRDRSHGLLRRFVAKLRSWLP